MAYDLHNPYGSTQPLQSASIEDAKAEVDYWVNKGLAKEKAVFGVPFYGFSWVNGKAVAKLYSEILAAVPEAATMDQVQLNGATTYLNSRATIIAKTKLAYQYGGIMVWEVGQDAAGDASLLKAMAETKP
jgi:spore germination protein YaaH